MCRSTVFSNDLNSKTSIISALFTVSKPVDDMLIFIAVVLIANSDILFSQLRSLTAYRTGYRGAELSIPVSVAGVSQSDLTFE